MRVLQDCALILMTVVVASGCADPERSPPDSGVVVDAQDSIEPSDGGTGDMRSDEGLDCSRDMYVGSEVAGDTGLEVQDDVISYDATCSDVNVPTHWNADDAFLESCTETACVDFGKYCVDFVLTSMTLESLEWVTSTNDTAPECLTPDPDYLLVRVLWYDYLVDLGYKGEIWGTMPCGGHCHVSTGKVYLVNTATDQVLYLGDQDPSAWPEGIFPESTVSGRKFVVSDNKTYIFANSTVPLCSNGEEFSAENMSTCGLSNWAVCFLKVRKAGELDYCIHFPLDANPGECPTTRYYIENSGRCAAW